MRKKTKNPLAAAVGAAFATSLSAAPVASAADNPFGLTELGHGYQLAQQSEGKCGEGKCGTSTGRQTPDTTRQMGEGKCGSSEMGKGREGQCGAKPASKTPEGQCGGAKHQEGRCGSAR